MLGLLFYPLKTVIARLHSLCQEGQYPLSLTRQQLRRQLEHSSYLQKQSLSIRIQIVPRKWSIKEMEEFFLPAERCLNVSFLSTIPIFLLHFGAVCFAYLPLINAML